MTACRHPAGCCRGFTLIELMLVLCLLAILVAVGMPSLGNLMATTHLSAAKNALVLGLQRARSEAVASGRDVVLCPSSDGLRCAPGSDWSSGWLLYMDNNNNARFDPVEPLLLTQALDARRVSVRSTGGRRTITYRSLGEAPGSNVTFVVCSRQRPDQGRQVIVANSGRVRSLSFAPPSACSR